MRNCYQKVPKTRPPRDIYTSVGGFYILFCGKSTRKAETESL